MQGGETVNTFDKVKPQRIVMNKVEENMEIAGIMHTR